MHIDSSPPPNHHLAGIGFMVVAMGLFASMDALAKLLGGEFSILQLVFFRNLGAITVVFPLFITQAPADRALKKPVLVGLRMVLGMATLVGFFTALQTLGMAEVGAITFTSPLFVTLMAVPFLGEEVGWRRWVAILVGFAGVMIILQPSGGVLSWGAAWALMGALGYATLLVVLRIQGRTMTSLSSAFWLNFMNVIVLAPVMPFVWTTPSPTTFGLLMLLGMVGGLGQTALAQSVRLAPASVVAPFDYTYLMWATLLGWLVFDTLPLESTLWGMPVVAASGLYLLHRESRTTKRSVRPAEAATSNTTSGE